MDIKGHEQLLSKLRTKYPKAIRDGTVNEDFWSNLPNNRILWVLREVNDFPWDLRCLSRQFANAPVPTKIYKNWKDTYGSIVQVSYGIITGCREWGPWAKNVDAIRTILNEIAVIDVNKCSGTSASDPKALTEAAEKFHDIIVKQIELLDPNIVILGGVKQFISKWLPMNDTNRKWIDAPYPGQKDRTHQQYYDLILKEVRK